MSSIADIHLLSHAQVFIGSVSHPQSGMLSTYGLLIESLIATNSYNKHQYTTHNTHSTTIIGSHHKFTSSNQYTSQNQPHNQLYITKQLGMYLPTCTAAEGSFLTPLTNTNTNPITTFTCESIHSIAPQCLAY